MDNQEVILARHEIMVEDLQQDLKGIIDAVKKKNNKDIIDALQSVVSDISKTIGSIKVNSPSVDLGPLKEAIQSISLQSGDVIVDTSSLEKTLSNYADNLVSLESKIEGLESKMSSLIDAINNDVKVSVERNQKGQISNLYLIKNNKKK